MAWELSGQMLESCNCELLCPCWFDVTATPDQGWCGTALVFDIQRGTSDGIDLSGRTVVLAATIPGAFADGNMTVRLYVDERASPEQRRELEAIFSGQKGGPLGALGPLIQTVLPTKTLPISWQRGETIDVRLGDVALLHSAPRSHPSGQPTRVVAAEAMGAFDVAEGQPAKRRGTVFHDPDMRQCYGDSGMMSRFTWRG